MFCLLYICESILSVSIDKTYSGFLLLEGEMKDRKTPWKVYLIQLLKPIKSTAEFITNAKTFCAHTIVLMASPRGEI